MWKEKKKTQSLLGILLLNEILITRSDKHFLRKWLLIKLGKKEGEDFLKC